MRKYTITMTEEQLALAVACIEDIHRFLAGQTELYNATTVLDNSSEVQGMLKQLHPLVTPGLPPNASYGWDGMHCPNELQRKMIAATYYLYREMRHKYNLANKKQDVYTSETLRCKDSGEPIIITREELNMSKQVLDVEQMLHLQELGLELKQSIIHYYKVANIADANWYLSITNGDISKDNDRFKYIPAYTLQDVLDLLPESITMGGEEYYLVVEKDAVMYVLWTGVAQMTKVFGKGKCTNNPQPLIDYAYEMLCWCIGNGYVKTGKEGRK